MSKLEKSNKLLTDNQIDNKLTYLEQKKEILEKINEIKQDSEKNDYLLDTCHMLFHYFDEDNFSEEKVVSKKKNSKKTVVDFFSNSDKSVTSNVTDNKVPKEKKETPIKSIYKDKKEIMHKYFSIVNKEYIPYKQLDYTEIDSCVTCNESRIFDSIQGIMLCPKCGCEEKILIDNDTPS